MLSYLIIVVMYATGNREGAVRLAVATIDDPHHKQFDRIWQFLGEQDEVPLCNSCGYPEFSDDPHYDGFCLVREHAFSSLDSPWWSKVEQDWEDFNAERDALLDLTANQSDNEDPLAGDVEPTGGYNEPTPHAFDAHRLSVMRQYGDYT